MPELNGGNKLYPVCNDERGNPWCGPAAISIIVGCPISEAKDLLRFVRPAYKRRITGVGTSELWRALARRGVTPATHDSYPDVKTAPTLTRWLKTRKERNGLYLLSVGSHNKDGHYIVVKGRKLCDNQTMDPVFIRQRSKYRRSRVHKTWLVQAV